MKFNKNISLAGILSIFLISLLGLGGIFLILSIPFFSVLGFTSLLEFLHIKNLLSIDYYDHFAQNFMYICMFIVSIWILLIISELLFLYIKTRKIINTHSKLEIIVTFIVILSFSFFITKVILLPIFHRIHLSTILLLAILFAIHLEFFINKTTYAKE